MKEKIVIVDYGMGNLNSVKRKFHLIGINAEITSSVSDIRNAGKLVIPGVGHFKKAVENLKQLQLWDALNEAALIKKKPILGICLGLQLMGKHSEEGDVDGFGWFNSEVVRFKIADKLKHKIPHMGWNSLRMNKTSPLFEGVSENSVYYFVHSYHMLSNKPSEVLCYTNYEYDFVSALEKDNIFGLQFHPEKSHDYGEKLLLNFSKL